MLRDPKPPEDHRFFHGILSCNVRDHLCQILIAFNLFEKCRVGIRVIQDLLFELVKSFGTVLNKTLVIQLFIHNDIRHHIQYKQIGFKRNDTVMFRKFNHFCFTHIDHSKVVMLFCHINDTIGDDRMCFHGIGTDDHHKFCFVNIIVWIGGSTLTHRRPHPFKRRRVTDPGTVVYVWRVHGFTAEFLESISRFTRGTRTADGTERVSTVFLFDLIKFHSRYTRGSIKIASQKFIIKRSQSCSKSFLDMRVFLQKSFADTRLPNTVF